MSPDRGNSPKKLKVSKINGVLNGEAPALKKLNFLRKNKRFNNKNI